MPRAERVLEHCGAMRCCQRSWRDRLIRQYLNHVPPTVRYPTSKKPETGFRISDSGFSNIEMSSVALAFQNSNKIHFFFLSRVAASRSGRFEGLLDLSCFKKGFPQTARFFLKSCC